MNTPMNELVAVPFISRNGIRGTVMLASRLLDDTPEKTVTFETGGKRWLAASTCIRVQMEAIFWT